MGAQLDRKEPFEDDDGRCMCGYEDCAECGGRSCSYCGGRGWGIVGDDWENDDPVNFADGGIETCPNCGGSGDAKDMTFW